MYYFYSKFNQADDFVHCDEVVLFLEGPLVDFSVNEHKNKTHNKFKFIVKHK